MFLRREFCNISEVGWAVPAAEGAFGQKPRLVYVIATTATVISVISSKQTFVSLFKVFINLVNTIDYFLPVLLPPRPKPIEIDKHR